MRVVHSMWIEIEFEVKYDTICYWLMVEVCRSIKYFNKEFLVLKYKFDGFKSFQKILTKKLWLIDDDWWLMMYA